MDHGTGAEHQALILSFSYFKRQTKTVRCAYYHTSPFKKVQDFIDGRGEWVAPCLGIEALVYYYVLIDVYMRLQAALSELM